MRLVVLAVVIAAALTLWQGGLDANPLGPRLDGDRLVVRSAGLETRFVAGGAFRGAYMILDGRGEDDARSNVRWEVLEHAELARLSILYPDLHRAGSAGAAAGKARALFLVAADGGVRRILQGALLESRARLASGGARVCVTLAGRRLALEDVATPPAGAAGADTGFRYVEQAAFVDCRSTLAPPGA